MFGFLLFIKSFHWLASDRIEWVCLLPFTSQSNLPLDRWTNDHIQAHRWYFTLGCQLSSQSYGGLIALCSYSPLSALYLPASEEWCSSQVRLASHSCSLLRTSGTYPWVKYGILMASVMNTIAKYLLSAYDLRRAGRRGGENAPPWENKSMWVFYIELTTGENWVSCSFLSIAQRKQQTSWSWQHILSSLLSS